MCVRFAQTNIIKATSDIVKTVIGKVDNIDNFNKKAIYLYMREITGLNTKQVVNNLNKMRIRYRVFREKWDKGDL